DAGAPLAQDPAQLGGEVAPAVPVEPLHPHHVVARRRSLDEDLARPLRPRVQRARPRLVRLLVRALALAAEPEYGRERHHPPPPRPPPPPRAPPSPPRARSPRRRRPYRSLPRRRRSRPPRSPPANSPRPRAPPPPRPRARTPRVPAPPPRAPPARARRRGGAR